MPNSLKLTAALIAALTLLSNQPASAQSRDDVPAHHRAVAALDAYLASAELEEPRRRSSRAWTPRRAG